MAVKSKRLRFEILKRDNFTCHYCGATPLDRPLHVDHVIAEANGGTDDPANLITACKDCNGGKSSIPLEERRLKKVESPEELLEYAEQVREYLQAQREVVAAKDEVLEVALDRWREHMGNPLKSHVGHIRKAVQDLGIAKALEAIDVTGQRGDLYTDMARIKYFCGVVRNWREGRQGPAKEPPPKTYTEAEYQQGRWEMTFAWVQAYWTHRVGDPFNGDIKPRLKKALGVDKPGQSDDSPLRLDDIFRIIDEVAFTRDAKNWEQSEPRFADLLSLAINRREFKRNVRARSVNGVWIEADQPTYIHMTTAEYERGKAIDVANALVDYWNERCAKHEIDLCYTLTDFCQEYSFLSAMKDIDKIADRCHGMTFAEQHAGFRRMVANDVLGMYEDGYLTDKSPIVAWPEFQAVLKTSREG